MELPLVLSLVLGMGVGLMGALLEGALGFSAAWRDLGISRVWGRLDGGGVLNWEWHHRSVAFLGMSGSLGKWVFRGIPVWEVSWGGAGVQGRGTVVWGSWGEVAEGLVEGLETGDWRIAVCLEGLGYGVRWLGGTGGRECGC